jgi:hypothetical protein
MKTADKAILGACRKADLLKNKKSDGSESPNACIGITKGTGL